MLDGVPLIVPILLTAIVLVAGFFDAIPPNMIGGLAVITSLGMLLGPLGNRLPVISKIGGGALVCLMVPSILVYFGAVNDNTLAAATALMKEANFLYFVICTLVVGSILGMHRTTMLRGLMKVFPPLIIGTISAVTVGVGVAMVFGYSFERALFYIVVPIIGGGIGEGIIPLSSAYSGALGGTAETYMAQLIPAAVIGNVVAIVLAGLLRRLGDRRPALDGGGLLVKPKPGDPKPGDAPVDGESRSDAVDAAASITPAAAPAGPNVAIGVLTICTLFVLGTLAEPVLHLPAPVLVIVFSVIAKVLNIFPASVEDGARAVYGVVSKHFVYPTMIGLGMLYIPLANVVSVLSVGYVVTCAAVVVTMALSGFFVGKKLGMFPVDASLVTVCHSGLGGTGDVAILSASNRMVMMPFAQISTRIGGVTTVISAASLIHFFA
ncbi:2-hydroxycarboxylate transporter family protein [Pengzhenrongella sp.]|jgi:malate:Na+ symporter|uniref:2-hydroxycarboxylate transporter family protein n=1 Tax=Pengzhenrongella sp. TaxID=2888820 RepID=UPI002F91C537